MEFVRWNEETLPIDEVCELWNREIGAEFPMTKMLFQQNSVHCPHLFHEGSWYVKEKEKVIGFIVTKYTREREDLLPEGVGWINALLVHSDYRNRGIGKRLLLQAEEALASRGISKITTGRDMNHYFPGIPSFLTNTQEWFTRQGFERVNQARDFYRSAPTNVEGNQPKDITMSILQISEKEFFLTFMNESFPGRWEYEVTKYFEQGGDGSHFLVAKLENEIIGFVRVNDLSSPVIGPNVYWHELFEEKLGGIGPLGIKKEHRKKGYGAAIVDEAMYIAFRRGCKHLVIDWTELDAFYQSFGFEKWKEYVQFSKILKDE